MWSRKALVIFTPKLLLVALLFAALLVAGCATGPTATTQGPTADLPAWGPRFARPGTRLALVEFSRRPAQVGDGVPPQWLGCTFLTYSPVGSGFPAEQEYQIWTKWSQQLKPVPANVFVHVDTAGRLVTRDGKQFVVPVGCFVQGQGFELGLISADGSVKAFAEVIPFPLEARDGSCRLTVRMEGSELFAAIGDGFPPGSQVEVIEQSDDEGGLPSPTLVRDDGTTGYILILPATIKHGYHASVAMKGDSCAVKVEYAWGPPALLPQ